MKFDYQNAGIYAGATRAFRTNFASILFFSVILVALEFLETFLDSSSGLIVGKAMLHIVFAYLMHRTVLGGEPINHWKANSIGPQFMKFVRRSGLILFAIFLSFIPPFIMAFTSVFPAEALVLVILIYAIVILFPSYGIFLSLYGTMLPAAVAGDDTSLRSAYRRSRGQVLSTLLRFLIGPALVTLFLFVIIYVLGSAEIPFNVYDETARFELLGAIFSFLLYILAFYPSTLAVVILCKAYLNATPQTDNP